MLRPEKMLRVQIGVLNEHLDPALRSIGLLSVLHVTPFSDSAKGFKGLAQPVEPREESFKISALLSRAEALLSLLGLQASATEEPQPTAEESGNLAEAAEYLGNIEAKVASIRDRISRGETADEGAAQADVENAREELQELAAKEKGRLSRWHLILENLGRVEAVRNQLGKSGSVNIIEGWIPAKQSELLRSTLENACEGKYLLEMREPSQHGGKPPTLVRLPKIFENFESLTSGFGIQTYGEINPAVFMLMTFPLLFGLMFGDVGHGALLLIFALIAYRHKRRGAKVPETLKPIITGSPLLIMLGVSSIVFGYLYGEVFGTQPAGGKDTFAWFALITGSAHPPWFNPFEDMSHGGTTFLTITFIVGIFHILFGISISLVNKLLLKEYKHAIAGPLLWLWLYGGCAYFFFTNTLVNHPDNSVQFFSQMLEAGNFTVYVALPLAAMLVGRILVEGFMEGFGSTLESFLSSLAHTISYSRILALNVVHAVFSAMPFFFSSSVTDPIFIGAFLASTLLIMILELLISFLNTLRLHWVEWFMKFYKGDGIRFQPFTLSLSLASP